MSNVVSSLKNVFMKWPKLLIVYEAAHLSSLNIEEVRAAIDDLHAQHLILMRAADEEQLVDSSDQEELQTIYNRLFRVITIYEDHQGTIETPTIVSRDDDAGSTISGDPYTHPLVAIVGEVNKEIIERGVQRDMNPALRKLEKDSSMISLPSSVRSRSSSLRSYAGKKNVTLSAVIVPRDSATRPKDLLAKDSSRDPSSAGRGARGEGRTPSPLSASNSDPSPATASRSSPLSEPNSSVSAHAVESLCSSARNSIAPVRSVSITEALEHFPVPSEEPILGLGRLVAVTKATMPSMSSSSLKEALDAISENLDRAVATTVVTETGEKQNVQKPLLQGLEGIVTKTTVNVSIGANAESENLCTSAGASPEF
ncbi:hypothetical protein BC829DRAFT_267905 [Chytridium lagenaria]|nr:hypothetical protein BC829DRAFT_267905 [Chytridium lagenaria]